MPGWSPLTASCQVQGLSLDETHLAYDDAARGRVNPTPSLTDNKLGAPGEVSRREQ